MARWRWWPAWVPVRYCFSACHMGNYHSRGRSSAVTASRPSRACSVRTPSRGPCSLQNVLWVWPLEPCINSNAFIPLGVLEMGWHFVLAPVLVNALAMVLLAVILNCSFKWRRYPAILNKAPWPSPASTGHRPPSHEEVVSALRSLDSFVDISEAYLLRLVEKLSPDTRTNQASKIHAESNGLKPAFRLVCPAFFRSHCGAETLCLSSGAREGTRTLNP